MTGALAIMVAAAAIVGITIFGMLAIGKFGGRWRDPDLRHGDGEHWLAEAGAAVAAGRRIAAELADIPASGDARIPADMTEELDRLTAQLVELSANAPTAMDTRVCRSVGVRSQALSTALRAPQQPDGSSSRGNGRRPPRAMQAQTEFHTALRDLADHVELL